MKNKFKFTKKEVMIKSIIVGIIFALLVLSFFFSNNIETFLGLRVDYYQHQVAKEKIVNSNFMVSYLDVGQGNCSVIRFPDDKIMVIDGGSLDNGQKIINYLESMSIDKIDYMIATHSDSDHIGGLITLLDNFEVKNIFRPFQISGTGTSHDTFVPNEDEDLAEVYNELKLLYGDKSKISRVTSDEYSKFISKIYSETYCDNEIYDSANVIVFYDGLKVEGEGYYVEFFAPLKREDNINLKDYSNTEGYATIGYGVTNSNGNSAIFTVTIDNEKFLFTGDAPWSDSDVGKNETFEELDFVNSLTDS